MTASPTHVIVGASQAGGRAAQAMRAAGFSGAITLIGDEPWLPYERPPLSKALLIGDAGIETAQLHPRAFYDDNDITLLLDTRVVALDRAARSLRMADGREITYDKLLLTTGARVRKLPIPGAELPGIRYLRDYADSEAIRARLRETARVIVIGGGFIGLEVAASARMRGCPVTMLEMADRLMGRAVAPEIGAYFADLHRDHGVDLRLGVEIAEIVGDDRVAGVRLADGTIIPADLIVVGIGIVPNVELAAEAGLAVDNGIVVDEFGRSSDPDIYAAGDVANQPNAFLGRRIRLESYQNAQDQAMAVGRNMCGELRPYNDRLWVWSDQYDVNLQMLGAPRNWDRLVVRGEMASGRFTVFYMAAERIVAVNTVNNGKEMRVAERLMMAGNAVDDARLADVSVKLRSLMAR